MNMKARKHFTLWVSAVMTGLAVYMLFALLFATRVPEEILLSDHSIILQLGKFRILIVAGIMLHSSTGLALLIAGMIILMINVLTL